jgi:spermidine synthase
MILELAAGRLCALKLGSSLYTWTGVIGVVLAGMTVGNYIGGKLADRFADANKKVVSSLFVIASILSVLTIVLANSMKEWDFIVRLSWPVQVVTYISLLFLPSSVFLGAVYPAAAKAALEHRKGTGPSTTLSCLRPPTPAFEGRLAGASRTGRIIGAIYAFGAAGSIAGTFLAGFWLISAIGTAGVIWATSATLAATGLICNQGQRILKIWAAMLAVMVVLGTAHVQWIEQTGALLSLRQQPDPRVIYEDDSQYSHIRVVQESKKPDKRLFYQDKLQHSVLIMGDITNLRYDYERVYAATTEQISAGRNNMAVLAIGGGGFVFPRYLKQKWPASRVDVAEIDPAVPKAAMAAFGLAKDSGINIFIMDGRNFIDGLIAKKQAGRDVPDYDCVYGDAFDNFSVPYQLLTREFNNKVARILKEDGVYMLNIVDIYDSGLILGSVLNTLEQTFPHVYVLSPNVDQYNHNTYVLIASRRTIDADSLVSELGRYYRDVWLVSPEDAERCKERCGRIVLTDDYAPTDNLTAPIARRTALVQATNTHIKNAQRYKDLGYEDKFISECFEAMRPNTTLPLSTYLGIADDLMNAGEFEEAIVACKKALERYDRPGMRKDISPVYLCMGTAMKNRGQKEEAKKYFQKVIEEHTRRIEKGTVPTGIIAELGTAYISVDNIAEAVRCYERAVKAEPANPTYRYMLSEALIQQKNYAGAEAAINDAINAMKQADNNEAVPGFQKLLRQVEFQRR